MMTAFSALGRALAYLLVEAGRDAGDRRVTPSPSPGRDRESGARAAAARAADARARFDAAEKRFDEFRNRARLLATAVGVFMGLELTLVPRFVEFRPATLLPVSPVVVVFGAAVLLLLVTLSYQALLLSRLFQQGYISQRQHGLPNAIDVVRTAEDFDEEETHHGLARAYANAASHWDQASGDLAGQVSTLARRVAASMWLVVGVVLSLFVLLSVQLFFASPERPEMSKVINAGPEPPPAKPTEPLKTPFPDPQPIDKQAPNPRPKS